MVAVAQEGALLTLSWNPVSGADSFNVIRGDATSLAAGLYGTCLAEEQTGTTFEDADVPDPGRAFAYFIQGDSRRCGPGLLGFTSDEEERINVDPAACPAHP